MDPYCRYLKLIAIIAVIYTQPGNDILMMNDIATLVKPTRGKIENHVHVIYQLRNVEA